MIRCKVKDTCSRVCSQGTKGCVLNHGKLKDWTTTELQWLKDNYKLYAYTRDLVDMLPRHTYGSIGKKLEELGLTNIKHHYTYTSKYYLRVWWAICECEGAPEQIAEKLGCRWRTVDEALKLFKAAKAVHVSRWVKLKTRGHWRPVYTRGEGINTNPPKVNGKRRTPQVDRLHSLAGNPFALMIDAAGVNREALRDTKHQEDVCTG